MLHDEDYDSDTSDEDFVPEDAESEDEPVSDGVDEGDDNKEDDEQAQGKKKKKKSSKKKKKNPLLASLPETEEKDTEKVNENIVENEEKDKERKDSLWADFLADVDDKPSPPPKPKKASWGAILGNKNKVNSSTNNLTQSSSLATGVKKTDKKENKLSGNTSTVKITKVFEFAGEEVRVEKEVDANSEEAKEALVSPNSIVAQEDGKAPKRPGGGLSSIMGMIDNKKQKLSTLEKTKLDWTSFKSHEGLDEELECHKKSKDGYLDKQAFLERADHRQFEIERAMRMNKRSNR